MASASQNVRTPRYPEGPRLRGTALAGLGEDAPELPPPPPRPRELLQREAGLRPAPGRPGLPSTRPAARRFPFDTRWLWIGGGVALIGVAVWQRKNIAKGAQMAFDVTKSAAFKAVLAVKEPNAVQYADLILSISSEKDVSPFVTVALGHTESVWGKLLDSNMTGDYIARVDGNAYDGKSWTQKVDTLPKGWVKPKDSKGNPLPGPYYIPADGMGWGRGIMQVDLPRVIAENHNWRDPAANIRLGLTIYGEHKKALTAAPSGSWNISEALGTRLGVPAGSYPAKSIPADLLDVAALAAYNAGAAAIRRAYSAAGAAGIDKVTHSGDYATQTSKTLVALQQEYVKASAA